MYIKYATVNFPSDNISLLSKAYLEKLEKFMDDQFQQYSKINESKNIFKSARTPITLFIVLAVAYVAHVS